jgi:hypothetical protein
LVKDRSQAPTRCLPPVPRLTGGRQHLLITLEEPDGICGVQASSADRVAKDATQQILNVL